MVCRIAAAAGAALLLAAGELHGQNSVMLRLRPRIGDTLHMRLDQRMDMEGRSVRSADPRTMATTLRVRARAIPTRMAGDAMMLTTVTDSFIVSSPVASTAHMERTRRSLEGRPVEVRVLPDGAMEVVNPDQHDDDASPLFGNLPAVFPSVDVRPGDQWTREMRLPLRGSRVGAASVRATFRLDSLGRDGRIAYISVRGTFYERAPGAPAVERALEGSLSGAMEFDRDLGWISDSRTTITIRSEVRVPDSRRSELQPSEPRSLPTEVWMRITQRLQARTTP